MTPHGDVGRAAVAAAREEAADASDDVAERDAGREHVARPSQIGMRWRRMHQSATIDARASGRRRTRRPTARATAARAGSGRSIPQSTISSISFAPISALMMIQMPRSMIRVESRPRCARADQRQLQPEQVGQRQQQAVAVDGEPAEFKQSWVHVAPPGAYRESAGRRRS